MFTLDYIMELIDKKKEPYREIIKRKLTKKSCICLFPAGVGSSYIQDYIKDNLGLDGIKIDYISDNDENKLVGELYGLRCKTVEELWDKWGKNITFLIESAYYKEIKSGLEKRGFDDIQQIFCNKSEGAFFLESNKESIRSMMTRLLEVLEDRESEEVVKTIISSWALEDVPNDYLDRIKKNDIYFDREIWGTMSTDECFVDCGAYIGDTTQKLLRRTPDFKGTIYQFEVDPIVYKKLYRNMEKYKSNIDIVSFPYGVSDKQIGIQIKNGEGNSRILQLQDKKEELKSRVVRLDDILAGKQITFIKMDIEGSEWEALHGAEDIIKSQSPKLAICLYHRPEDLFRIPMYLKKLVPSYKIYVRHYSCLLWDTVCYAVPDSR
ncbi:FkbM family methyltransferase [Lachnospiraceae bacterium 29-84]